MIDPSNFGKAVKENTRAIFVESLGNPKLDVLDLKAISAEAKAAKIPFIVDNTVPPPALLNPIEHGANIVIHSLTKYINGNGTALGGAVIDAGTFDWANGKFPENSKGESEKQISASYSCNRLSYTGSLYINNYLK